MFYANTEKSIRVSHFLTEENNFSENVAKDGFLSRLSALDSHEKDYHEGAISYN